MEIDGGAPIVNQIYRKGEKRWKEPETRVERPSEGDLYKPEGTKQVVDFPEI